MTKRIKLKVRRNRLPDVDVLWAVKENEGREPCTVAKLIADVDHAIPLEAGDWTLDQYVVELDGFECLHYQYLSDILKDGDSVTIRPLGSPDVRARRLGGRTQITGEGFHILDGVPYGMQPNQRPARPGILIPSRKRRRPDMEEEDYADDEGTTIADIEDDEELLAHVNGGTTVGELIVEPEEEGERRPNKKQKNVHFNYVKEIPGFDVEEDDSDEEDDGEFDPDAVTGSSGEESEDGDDAEEENVELDDDSGSDSSSEASSTSSEDSSSSEESDSSEASTPEVLSSRQPDETPKINGVYEANGKRASKNISQGISSAPQEHGNIPYQGKKTTKDRNKRRRVYARLMKVVRGILGDKATKEQCSDWLQRHPEKYEQVKLSAQQSIDKPDDHNLDDSIEDEFTGFPEEMDETEDNILITPAATNEDSGNIGALNKLLNKAHEPPNTSVNDNIVNKSTKKPADLTRRRQELIEAIGSGGIVNTSSDEPKSIVEAEKEADSGTKRSADGAEIPESPDSKRVRLNINGSRRAIFGALGMRTPKTQEDADRIRAKLAALGRPKPVTPAAKQTLDEPEEVEEAEEADEDPLSNAWRRKIHLMAVDCDNPEIELSEPPYPFKQRWDPSQQRKGTNWWTNGGKQRKKKARNSYGQEWDEEEDVSYLEYDELEYDDEDEEYADGDVDVAEFAQTQELSETEDLVDDLPSLPADVSVLPNLTLEDAVPGAVVAFKQLECNQATKWTPVISAHHTAKILKFSDRDLLSIKLAMRDRDVKEIKYDQDGKRLYEKFEMDAGDEDEDEVDDGIREIRFAEMVEPKLVKVATEAEVEAETASD